MGLLLSSEEELSQARDVIGSLLYDAMLEGRAVPDLGVAHPLLLTNHSESLDSKARLQEHLRQLQADVGSKAPAYLKDLIGRLSSLWEEPRLAGLVGLAVTVVMDVAFNAKRSAGRAEAGSPSGQHRAGELQEVMEEYLKRCRMHLGERGRLLQDAVRLEARLSLALTRLKAGLLGGACDSRSMRLWASGAAFHAQVLLHLDKLQGIEPPAAATAALELYREDLVQIIPAYRRYKSSSVSVVKCRGFLASCDSELQEDGAMTGVSVTDRETGKTVTVPLAAMTERSGSSLSPDLITSDHYAHFYLHRLFSCHGPVAALQDYFTTAAEDLRTETEPRDGGGLEGGGEEEEEEQGGGGGEEEEEQGGGEGEEEEEEEEEEGRRRRRRGGEQGGGEGGRDEECNERATSS